MSGSGALDVPKTEDFFYTTPGLITLVIIVIVLTSLVWLVGIICYCCCRHHLRYRNTSEHEPSTDVCFLSAPSDNGTLQDTSAEHDTINFSYSINSLAHEPAFHHTSLESILSGELDKQDENIT